MLVYITHPGGKQPVIRPFSSFSRAAFQEVRGSPGQTPLRLGAYWGKTDDARLLAEKGARVDAGDKKGHDGACAFLPDAEPALHSRGPGSRQASPRIFRYLR